MSEQEQQPKPRLVHMASIGAGKWMLGRAACGCTISRWTPTAKTAAEVTCPRCRKKLSQPPKDKTNEDLF